MIYTEKLFIKRFNSIFKTRFENIEDIDSKKIPKKRLDFLKSRSLFINTFGYALLTFDVIKQLEPFISQKRVHDVGAGTGYAHFFLSKLHPLEIVHSDIDGSVSIIDNFRIEDSVKLEKELQSDVVFLSWPPYGDSFAFDISKIMKRKSILIYIGEQQFGCTASDSFFRNLKKSFELLQILFILSFEAVHDTIYVFKKQ